MFETFQTLIHFCGIVSMALAIPWSIDKMTGRRQRRVARNAAFDVLVSHMVDHRDAWAKDMSGSHDYTLSFGSLKVAFDFSYYGTVLNRCSVNNETIPDKVGWKLHRAYLGGDTSLSHVIVKAIRPKTPLMLASAAS